MRWRWRSRKGVWSLLWLLHGAVMLLHVHDVTSMLLLKSNCLSSWPNCTCSWKSGKFVADCASQSLNQVPKNDYYEYLQANAGNNQMPTLNRDIQQLNVASNNIGALKRAEFYKKKFRNLQKIYLNTNQLTRVASSAFYKMTGLIELDLSENLISRFDDTEEGEEEDVGTNEVETSDETEFSAKNNNRSSTSNHREETSTKANTHQSSAKSGKASFLQDLVQLRQLNLASNQLSRLDKFTFSPLTQLRQLYLSRNQISYIDKRAFDGLNVLNILHLDGNKLSHLHGDILFKLPQLYGLRLAGSNPWRCDCELRKLVRALLQPADGHDAQGRQQVRANILEDEPRCAHHGERLRKDEGYSDAAATSVAAPTAASVSAAAASPSKDIGHQQQPAGTGATQDDRRPLWQNMKLGQFECPPRLIERLMPTQHRPVAATIHGSNSSGSLHGNNVNGDDGGASKMMNMNDKMASDGLQPEVARYEARFVAALEPIELSIAIAMTDELDLELVQVEWWHLDQQLRPSHALWLSDEQWTVNKTNGPIQNNTIGAGSQQRWTKETSAANDGAVWPEPTKKQRAQRRRQDYAIIDYVTRVNRSMANGISGQAEEGNNEELMAGSAANEHDGLKLIRVVHFVMDATSANNKNNNNSTPADRQLEPLERNFLCRITNQAGKLEVLFVVNLDSSDKRRARAEWRNRQLVRERLAREMAAGHAQQPLARWLPKAASWSLERAKAALVAALDSLEGEQLFVPLHMPEKLMRRSLDNVDDATETPAVRSQSQRPATRHTVNGTSALTSTNQPVARLISQADGDQLARQAAPTGASVDWSLVAQSLINRYTSNQQLLMEPTPTEAVYDDLDQLETGSSLQVSVAKDDISERRLAYWGWYIRTKYLDRWVQLAMGSGSLLLGLSAGLVVGCLLTALLVLRIQCAMNRVGQAPDTKKQVSERKSSATSENSPGRGAGDGDDKRDELDTESPPDGRLAGLIQQPHQQTSAGSSSSTTNGSHRKLIRDPAKACDTLRKAKRRNLLAAVPSNYFGDRYLDSSFHSDESELDADMKDSIESQAWAWNGGTWMLPPGPSQTSSSNSNNNNGTRLIVVSPQQELQELVVAAPSPFYLANNDGMIGQRYPSEQVSDADSVLLTYPTLVGSDTRIVQINL